MSTQNPSGDLLDLKDQTLRTILREEEVLGSVAARVNCQHHNKGGKGS